MTQSHEVMGGHVIGGLALCADEPDAGAVGVLQRPQHDDTRTLLVAAPRMHERAMA